MIDLGIYNILIEADAHQFILKQRKKVRDKKTNELKEEIAVLSYHGTLESTFTEAWRTAQRQQIMTTDCDLAEAVKIMNDIKQEFMDKLKLIRQAER